MEQTITNQSLLSDKAILEFVKSGKIVISPFIRDNLNTSSFDVTLGPYYFRESQTDSGYTVYNPYSESNVKRVWGECHIAETSQSFFEKTGIKLENIEPTDLIIWIKPGETILAHTNEFIGGQSTVTTMMKARSSLGRNFIEVCKCAGMGDIGYINRWTMEITNNSRMHSIPLVVGRRVAQIVFFDTDGCAGSSYENTGKYQTSNDINQLRENWKPSDMLPKMYKDREIKNGTKTFNPKDYPNLLIK
ncbi:dCTP deaminase [Tieghemostelium lacteum]|uniref:dCTP deaminase n=1 Tax=Tieghemostelium lacteum TaxID=361077 RepID=A0A151ZJB7_TIELA|nr:dCTP deaminase [Tieghemostelium lacteum]|eukprot:KYQ93980.1 dCTP deaminase [Tieghemostelium lacteum]